MGIEHGTNGTIYASSYFASGFEGDTARLNGWVDLDSTEGGWATALNDLEKWLMVRGANNMAMCSNKDVNTEY